MKEKVYFDLDGVLANWVEQFKKKCDIPLKDFEKMTSDERHKIKETLFDYDFYYTMKPIQKGVKLFEKLLKSGADISILSATGDINSTVVGKAKRDWVKKYFGDVEVLLVEEGEDKWKKIKSGYDKHILIDDREKVLNAWKEHGGIAIKFTQ